MADGPLSLWYRQPAARWVEALPVGNGSLGGMVFGGPGSEQIQFNEETVWTGHPREYQHPGAVKSLPEIRRLLAEGKQPEAEALAMQEFMSEPLAADGVSTAGRHPPRIFPATKGRRTTAAPSTSNGRWRASATRSRASLTSARSSRAIPTRSSSSSSTPIVPARSASA